MQPSDDNQKKPRALNRRTHLANERTFLSWIRTALGIMAFGFVLEKFSFFMKQYEIFIDTAGRLNMHRVASTDYSSFWGIILVGLGALIGVLAFFRYKLVEKQIDADRYQHSMLLDIMLTATVLVTGIFLIVYLFYI